MRGGYHNRISNIIFDPDAQTQRQESRDHAQFERPKAIATTRGTRLDYRILRGVLSRQREVTYGAIALSIAIALGTYIWRRGELGKWLPVLTGVVTLVGLVYLAPAKKNPWNPPVVEISQTDVAPGTAIRINVQHRGPATFDVLAANAVRFGCSSRRKATKAGDTTSTAPRSCARRSCSRDEPSS